MASSNEEAVTAIDRLREAQPALSVLDRARALWELGKPNLSGLVVITGILGFYLGATGREAIDWFRFVHLVFGMGLTASGACALNMVIERDIDRGMRRTRGRPIPSGRISARAALVYSLAIFSVGFVELAVFCGLLPALLALFTLIVYAFVYTPLKRRGPISIWIGAIPGAIPPVMGYASVRGEIGAGGLALFAILFLWQFPHFLSLAWMYRDDYARAGFRFLPEHDASGARTGRHILLGCIALVIASVVPAFLGMAGALYVVGALAAGAFFLVPCLRAARECSHARARSAFIASVTYLPVLLALLVLDRVVG